MNNPKTEKIDFAKIHRELYTASSKAKEVTAGSAIFLSCEGKGAPGGSDYQSAIEQLYGLAFTIKFMLKATGKLDFAVSRIECLWQTHDMDGTPRSEWEWQLLMRIPKEVKAADLAKAKKALQRKGNNASRIKRLTWKEGRCVQLMHMGPYDAVGESYKRLDEYAGTKGWKTLCPAHEIYISDPRRVPSARLKTILRLPISRI